VQLGNLLASTVRPTEVGNVKGSLYPSSCKGERSKEAGWGKHHIEFGVINDISQIIDVA
jgi:hypothetical protein